MIPSRAPLVEALAPTFTQPSAVSSCQRLLAWILCHGRHTLRRTAEQVPPDRIPEPSQRHQLDSYDNFFARSAWTPRSLAHRVGVLLLTRLKLCGASTLLVDDTLAHKRGQSVWGLGWFRDAVAATHQRVATASGHNGVVVAVGVCLPFTNVPILALPLLARLHLPGTGQPSCADLAAARLGAVLDWWRGRRFPLVGDGAYATKGWLASLDERVTFVGRMRGDAAVYDPRALAAQKGKRGPKAKKGLRLPKPKEAAATAARQRLSVGPWAWEDVAVTVSGCARSLQALAYAVVWPMLLGDRVLKVVVVRDPSGRMRAGYWFTTDWRASRSWVITLFAWSWASAVRFRASKQVLDIEAPPHWSQESVEKVALWVASRRQNVPLDHIRFIDALRWLRDAKPEELLSDLVVNPKRPNRTEPRVLKRRMKEYDLMNKRRNVLCKAIDAQKDKA